MKERSRRDRGEEGRGLADDSIARDPDRRLPREVPPRLRSRSRFFSHRPPGRIDIRPHSTSLSLSAPFVSDLHSRRPATSSTAVVPQSRQEVQHHGHPPSERPQRTRVRVPRLSLTSAGSAMPSYVQINAVRTVVVYLYDIL